MVQKLQSKPAEKRDKCNETVVPILPNIFANLDRSIIIEFGAACPAPERNMMMVRICMASQLLEI